MSDELTTDDMLTELARLRVENALLRAALKETERAFLSANMALAAVKAANHE